MTNVGDTIFKQKIAEIMQKNQLRQKEVADQAGIHQATLSLWLQNRISKNAKLEEALEKWMNVYQASKSRLSLNSIDRFDFLKMKRSRPSPFDRIDNNNGFGYIVPISINIELDNKKFKDQFLWDVNEPYLKVDHFAKVLATDHDLAPNFEIEVVKFMFKKPNEQAN